MTSIHYLFCQMKMSSRSTPHLFQLSTLNEDLVLLFELELVYLKWENLWETWDSWKWSNILPSPLVSVIWSRLLRSNVFVSGNSVHFEFRCPCAILRLSLHSTMLWVWISKKITHPNYFLKFHVQFGWKNNKNTKNLIFSLHIYDCYLI